MFRHTYMIRIFTTVDTLTFFCLYRDQVISFKYSMSGGSDSWTMAFKLFSVVTPFFTFILMTLQRGMLWAPGRGLPRGVAPFPLRYFYLKFNLLSCKMLLYFDSSEVSYVHNFYNFFPPQISPIYFSEFCWRPSTILWWPCERVAHLAL